MTNAELIAQFGPRESTQYDVVVVGAGPAGLAAAIRIKQLNAQLSVVVLEKGAEVGAHILSGGVMDPRAIGELIPDWKKRAAPLHQAVTSEEMLFLSGTNALPVPTWLLPDCLRNKGSYVISLGAVCKWLAQQAENLGVDIFPGFVADEILFDAQNRVCGVATGNMGLGKDGKPRAEFQLGMELLAKYTLFAEGARGHLGKQLIAHYGLDAQCDPTSWAIGIKELWEVPPQQALPGHVVHTAGWPIADNSFGGGFLYHLQDNKVALGFVLGLNYENPYMSPFDEMQRWKLHPAITKHIQGGKRIGYAARAINNGGLSSMPKLVFAGGAFIGCEAGMMNASRIKGSHSAIKSGMLAAESAVAALKVGRSHDALISYPELFQSSWLHQELQRAKNFKNWYKYGKFVGMIMTGIEQWLLPKLGISSPPWTVHNKTPDHACLKPAQHSTPISYPKPDGVISFDKASSVFLSNTNHEENQPIHLTLRDNALPVGLNLAQYAGPECRYCPAGVYEFIETPKGTQLQINAQNCVHCKTCDIKDPTQNIVWTAPQGGDGPNYESM